MAIEQVSAYQCKCGRCGKGFNTEGDNWPMVWINKDDLLTCLGNAPDWRYINNDWYCFECYIWNEDETELIVKEMSEQKPREQGCYYVKVPSLSDAVRMAMWKGDYWYLIGIKTPLTEEEIEVVSGLVTPEKIQAVDGVVEAFEHHTAKKGVAVLIHDILQKHNLIKKTEMQKNEDEWFYPLQQGVINYLKVNYSDTTFLHQHISDGVVYEQYKCVDSKGEKHTMQFVLYRGNNAVAIFEQVNLYFHN